MRRSRASYRAERQNRQLSELERRADSAEAEAMRQTSQAQNYKSAMQRVWFFSLSTYSQDSDRLLQAFRLSPALRALLQIVREEILRILKYSGFTGFMYTENLWREDSANLVQELLQMLDTLDPNNPFLQPHTVEGFFWRALMSSKKLVEFIFNSRIEL